MAEENRDKQIIEMMGSLVKDPKQAERVSGYTEKEYSAIPSGQKVPLISERADKKQDLGVIGGTPKTYIEAMLGYGSPDIKKGEGENVAVELNRVFGPGAHQTFYKAAQSMTPEQQLAFADFLQKFGSVTDPLANKDVGTKVRQIVQFPRYVGF
jgi:hypothetical protein